MATTDDPKDTKRQELLDALERAELEGDDEMYFSIIAQLNELDMPPPDSL